MRSSLTRKTLRDNRRSTLGWLVGVAAFLTIYTSAYRQVGKDADSRRQATDVMPEGVRDVLGWQGFADGAGYLEATVYSVFVPFLFIMFATILGARAIAGPEESGTLELLLANPVSRRSFVLQRFTALVLAVVLVSLVPLALMPLFDKGFDMGVGAAKVTAASVGLMLLALLFGTLALTVGAATGRRGIVFAVAGVMAVGGYLARTLGNLFDALQPMRWFSPFQYYLGGDPLRKGFDVGYLLV
ncbi:ABC transporter permease subunit, partial [Streptomyces sp. NPDC055078]